MNVHSLPWRKSSFSGDAGCVEVAPMPGGVAVRDTKGRPDTFLLFTEGEWDAFLAGVRNSEFNF